MAKMGSIPPEIPSIVERVPVGAIVSSCEFLRPYSATSARVSSDAFSLKNGDSMICSGTHLANMPLSFASMADSLSAVSIMRRPSLSQKSTASGDP